MVPTSIVVVTPLSDEASSFAPTPSHDHSVNEDTIPFMEPLKLAPWMDKGK